MRPQHIYIPTPLFVDGVQQQNRPRLHSAPTWPDPVAGGHLGPDLDGAVGEAEGERRAQGGRHHRVDEVLRSARAAAAPEQRARAPEPRQTSADGAFGSDLLLRVI